MYTCTRQDHVLKFTRRTHYFYTMTEQIVFSFTDYGFDYFHIKKKKKHVYIGIRDIIIQSFRIFVTGF